MSLGLDEDIVRTAELLLQELDMLTAGIARMRAELVCTDGFDAAALAETWDSLRFGCRLGAAAELGKLRAWLLARSILAEAQAPLPGPAYGAPRAGWEYHHPRRALRGKEAASGALVEAS